LKLITVSLKRIAATVTLAKIQNEDQATWAFHVSSLLACRSMIRIPV